MPNDKLPPWDARQRAPKYCPQEVRRAIDPETGRPFGKISLTQKLKLKTMNTLLRPFLTQWLPRQLLKMLSAGAAVIGATQESADQTALFLTAGAAWLLEIALSWLSVKWARKNTAPTL
jgi:hypothetical protein